jgi:hypothetical protein
MWAGSAAAGLDPFILDAPPAAWLVLVFSAVGPGALAALLQTKAQAQVSATQAQVLQRAVPWLTCLTFGLLRLPADHPTFCCDISRAVPSRTAATWEQTHGQVPAAEPAPACLRVQATLNGKQSMCIVRSPVQPGSFSNN